MATAIARHPPVCGLHFGAASRKSAPSLTDCGRDKSHLHPAEKAETEGGIEQTGNC